MNVTQLDIAIISAYAISCDCGHNFVAKTPHRGCPKCCQVHDRNFREIAMPLKKTLDKKVWRQVVYQACRDTGIFDELRKEGMQW